MNNDDKNVPPQPGATASCSSHDFMVKLAFEKYMELTNLHQVLVKANRPNDAEKVLVAIETAKKEYETELAAEKKRNEEIEKGNDSILDHSLYMNTYIDIFRNELDMMTKGLLELKQNPGNIESVREIFEATHTLKGMSSTMGFEMVANLTLEMENLIEKLRSRQLVVTSQIIDLLFETVGVLLVLMNDIISRANSTVDLNVISKKLNEAATSNLPEKC
ncbi:MAG: Hpt domain-containing protein [Candidatus Riflebacteria bacterium]|nr:Hpt domain-containing protein [Candidatus Riflebacteria bacterium]